MRSLMMTGGKNLLRLTLITLLGSASAIAAAPAVTAGNGVAHPPLWPVAHSPSAISDAATERRIAGLMSRMTLRQKIGQLIQADISAITPGDLAIYPLGSILAGGNSGPYTNERASAADWSRMVHDYRAASLRPAANGVAIPILFGVDAVHGHSNLPNATIFPHNIGLGAAHDPALIERIGAATASEVSASGIEWTFAPTLAVPQDLRWGRSYEGYSSDPQLVAAYSRAMITGLQGKLVSGRPLSATHIAATAKHFIGDGGTYGGKDQGDTIVGEAGLIRTHAQGYPAAINAGALTVMASFSSWNGIKNHGNASLLTGVLKQRMGFQGLVVGDWNGHGQVPGCTVTDCPQAIIAGIDLLMAPDSWKGMFDSLLRHAEAGDLPAARVDDAVRRVLRVKAKLGLLDHPDMRRLDPSRIGTPAHLELAREAVAKSLVLLKNEGSVLPIRPGAKVLIAGRGADSISMQSGGWTISWQGEGVTNSDFTNGRTIGTAVADAVNKAGGTTARSPDGTFAVRPDVAIVVFGESPYAEFQGDVPTLDYQPSEPVDLALLKRLKSQGIPVVSVFLSGRPMFTSPEINASDAFVAAWLPGTQGDGVADVLVARRDNRPIHDFTGRLPFGWPADARSPIIAPLFARGYGLSYRTPRKVGRLSEDPGMNVTAALNVENFMRAGRALAPWTLSLNDSGGSRLVAGGSETSPGGSVALRPADLAAQEDAVALRWVGNGSVAIAGPAADLSRQLNNAFALWLELRVDSAVTAPVSVEFGGATLDISTVLRGLPLTKASLVKIPLRCFADAGAKLSKVDSALRIESGPGLGLTLRSARISAVGEPLECPLAKK